MENKNWGELLVIPQIFVIVNCEGLSVNASKLQVTFMDFGIHSSMVSW